MIALEDYGDAGKFLVKQGWVLRPSAERCGKGTACCDAVAKTLWMRPQAYHRPNTRVRRYVVLHEVWHAVHWELARYDVDLLIAARHLPKWSAVEVVAEAACLASDRSQIMRRWVYASTVWHGKVGYKYRWKDVLSPEATDTVYRLRTELARITKENQ